MILTTVKAERIDNVVHIFITPLTVPQRDLNKASRKLKHLYAVAHDSDEEDLWEVPIAIINNISFPMHKDPLSSSWSLVVPNPTAIQILIGGNLHELGHI